MPRSGSTLLAAILRQNPRFRAAMSSPVGTIFNACVGAMGAGNEFSVFLTEAQKRDILMGIFDAYYREDDPDTVIFDTNRSWTSRLPALKLLFPQAKVICCVRNPAWILDSVERLVRRNALDVSRLFNNDGERASVFSRAEALAQRNRMIGFAHSALKEAYFSDEAGMMLLVDYDLLTARPEDTLRLIYRFIDEDWFAHDFEHLEYDAEEFDARLQTPGLHRVSGPVRHQPRRTILPPELFRQFSDLAFWIGETRTLANAILPQSQQAAVKSTPGEDQVTGQSRVSP